MVFTAGTLGRGTSTSSDSNEAASRLLAALAASRSATPNHQQESDAPNSNPNAEPSFSLPPLPSVPPAAAYPDWIPDWNAVPAEAGLALASILGGIQPAYFGESDSANQDILFEDLGGTLSAMDVELDWDSLEKSMKAAEKQQGAEAQGMDSGVAGMSEAPTGAGEWQGFFAQK